MKRMTGLLLAGILTIALLAGCSGTPDTPEESTAATSTAASETTPATSAADGSNPAGGTDTTAQTGGGGGTTAGNGGSKAPTKTTKANSGSAGGGWSPAVSNATPQEMDSKYPLRKNIKGLVKVFTPFPGPELDKCIELFKKTYPGTEIKTYITDNVVRDEKLMALKQARDMPDYVYTTYKDYPLRAVKGLTMAIDDYIQPHPSQSQILMNTYTSYKGKKYAVINQNASSMIFYNKGLFQRKGEKTPLEYYKDNNWTWNTLKTVAKRMTDDKAGIYGFATDYDNFFPLSAGQDVIKFQNGKAVLNLVNNQKYIKAHTFFTDMITVDKSTLPTRFIAREEFIKGNIAMGFLDPSHMKDVKFDYEYVPFPRMDKNSPYTGQVGGINGGFSIGNGAQNIEGGMAFGEMLFGVKLDADGGHYTNKLYGDVYKMSLDCNMRLVISWCDGYGLYGPYYADFCNWARTGTKDLGTLINENANLMTLKINEYQ